MRILGIDPGIRNTGWGVVNFHQGRLVHVANGVIRPDPKACDSVRLGVIRTGLAEVVAAHSPQLASIEQVFVAKSAVSALKLGMARGVAMMQCGLDGIDVRELNPIHVKKSVVGTGRASKAQMSAMRCRRCAGSCNCGRPWRDIFTTRSKRSWRQGQSQCWRQGRWQRGRRR